MKASAYFTVSDVGGKHGVKELKHELDALSGVLSVSVSENTGSIAVDYDTTGVVVDRMQKKIGDLGYEILNIRLDKHVM